MGRRPPLPLEGLEVIWTGSLSGAAPLLDAASKAGARVERHPLIEFRPPADPDRVAGILDNLDRYDWIVLTSKQAVRQLAHLPAPKARVASVGPSCTALLEEMGWRVHVTGTSHTALGLVESLIRNAAPTNPVLFVRGDKSLRTIPEKLNRNGWSVQEVEVYRTVLVPPARARAVIDCIEEQADVVVMGSPSSVRVLAEAVRGRDLSSIKENLHWLALGPTTFEALRSAGVAEPSRLERVDPDDFIAALGAHR